MNTPVEISVVILGYKAGYFLESFHKKIIQILEASNLHYEIVIVANYNPNSTDITQNIARKISTQHNKTLALTKQKKDSSQAMGWDMRSGLNAATGKTVCVIDGDGQIPPEDIPSLYFKLTKENLDMCKARRVTREDGVYRRLVSLLFNLIMKILFPGIISTDINGKPKIFTRDALDKLDLESNDWFIDGEIMIKARRYDFKVGEINTSFYVNPKTTSSISFRSNLEFLKNILLWKFREMTS